MISSETSQALDVTTHRSWLSVGDRASDAEQRRQLGKTPTTSMHFHGFTDLSALSHRFADPVMLRDSHDYASFCVVFGLSSSRYWKTSAYRAP
jgi:hypothetical protein